MLPKYTEWLLHDLRSENLDTRKRAAEELGKLKDSNRQVVEALLTAKESDPFYAVRKIAEESLSAPVHQEVLQKYGDSIRPDATGPVSTYGGRQHRWMDFSWWIGDAIWGGIGGAIVGTFIGAILGGGIATSDRDWYFIEEFNSYNESGYLLRHGCSLVFITAIIEISIVLIQTIFKVILWPVKWVVEAIKRG